MAAPVDPQMNGAPPESPMVAPERDEVAGSLLTAIRSLAEKAASEENGAEAQSWGAAAKSLADAFVVLDPQLDAVGVPLGHEMEKLGLEHAHKEKLESIRAQQDAPGQKRRKVKMTRDEHGRVDSYEEDLS